jgi:hypothetical protein
VQNDEKTPAYLGERRNAFSAGGKKGDRRQFLAAIIIIREKSLY